MWTHCWGRFFIMAIKRCSFPQNSILHKLKFGKCHWFIFTFWRKVLSNSNWVWESEWIFTPNEYYFIMSSENQSDRNLIAHVFTTYSNRSFIPKLCHLHPEQPVSIICENCVSNEGQSFCPKCFTHHHCKDKKEKHLGTWMSEEREKVSSNIQKVQK